MQPGAISNPVSDAVTAWLARWWDDRVGMVRYPSGAGSPHDPYQQPGVPLVRETAMWAVALLERSGPGDVERAERGLARVLEHQIDDPRSVVHGTWRRAPSEPVPGPEPREWIDYDPNWREFVGTALVLALAHEDALAPACVDRIERALRRACEGTLARAVAPEYTNIALMSAFLLDWAGDRLGEPEWRHTGEALGRAVADAYDARGAFAEHNSPTYYGIDLYGLALWRARGRSASLRERGAALEAALWRDLARFYHAGLRNLCGPWTRAYGMDMTRYVGTLGCWIAPFVREAQAPLPPLGDAVEHAHDLFELPLIGVLGSRPPEAVLPELRGFTGPRDVEQCITERPLRRATARLRERAMWGGEHSAGRFVHWQHHPATVHWSTPAGEVGWLRLVANAPVDAVADDGGLEVSVRTGLSALRSADLHVGLECWPPPSAGLDPAGRLLCPGIELALHAERLPEVERASPDGKQPVRIGWRFAAGHAPAAWQLRLEIGA